MSDEHLPPNLEDLDKKLKLARESSHLRDGGRFGKSAKPPSGIGMAFRLASDLVAGLLVGLVIGWGLDRWLDTKPFMLVLFFFVGAAAGMVNVFRSTKGYGLAVGYRDPGAKSDKDSDDGTQ